MGRGAAGLRAAAGPGRRGGRAGLEEAWGRRGPGRGVEARLRGGGRGPVLRGGEACGRMRRPAAGSGAGRRSGGAGGGRGAGVGRRGRVSAARGRAPAPLPTAPQALGAAAASAARAGWERLLLEPREGKRRALRGAERTSVGCGDV